MDREILFRGKLFDKDEWVYGDLLTVGSARIIRSKVSQNGFYKTFTVDRRTVGQFTGVLDKKGVKIFEGDILDCPRCQCTLVVSWNNGGFGNFDYWGNDIEVIGNGYDNLELLKKVKLS